MSLKILLADDSVTAQNMGKKILSDAGFEVVAVSNGSAALKKIPDIKPDLVILDIYMPGYTGLEVCQKIKEARQTSSLPVLLTVGKLEPFKARDASRVRADGFIVKPFEATELLATIKRIVGVLPEQGRTKAKNGEDSKSRVKQAKLAAQETEAEHLASTLRDVLPAESKDRRDEEQFEHETSEPAEHTGSTENKHEYAPAVTEEVHHESVPFAVAPGPENAEGDQEYQQSTIDAERESAKFRVDFDKAVRHAETAEEGGRFTASSFESWEKSRYTPHDPESRESALARIRAARETEATEQQTSDFSGGEDSAKISAPPVNAVFESEIEAPESAQVDTVGANASQESESTQQDSEPHSDFSSPVNPTAQEDSEAPMSGERSSPTHPPISGLADWAADLREETPRMQESAAVPFASKWIAEEAALNANESGLSLSQEMERSRTSDLESLQAEAEAAVEERETPSVSMTEAVSMPEPAESYSMDSSAQPAAHEAAPQPENAETVAALAKAAAAAAMSSIGEIREAVLASAAAAGAAGIGRDSIVIQPQASQQATEEIPSITSPVDTTQFAAAPVAQSADDIQGATIAAVTREVHEAGPADLNSDAIASIVNRVIEQMKPKLVAEIAKELTHKPKNE